MGFRSCIWGCIPMYSDTITLFCRREDKQKNVTWYPYTLHGVHLNMDTAAIVAKYGAESQDSVALNIRYTAVKNAVVGQSIVGATTAGTAEAKAKLVCGKQWLPPKEWQRQTDEDTITFTSGQKFDFFCVGTWGGESPIDDSAYGVDGFYDWMNAKNDYVYAITSVAMYTVIPHFEIMAK